MHYQVPCDLVLVWITEIDSNHIPFKVVEKVVFRKELLIPISVCQPGPCHE